MTSIRQRAISSSFFPKKSVENDFATAGPISSSTVDRRNIAHASSGYDGDGKTTVEIMNKEKEYGMLVDSYSPIGFELNNGLMVLGSMAVFARSVLAWNVWDPREINEETLSLFLLLVPKLDILILGVGDAENVPLVRRVSSLRTVEDM